jgi:hypothetical protein
MLKKDHSQGYNYMINIVRRNRVSPKNAEKRVRLNVSVQPSTKEKLDILRGEYSMASLVESVLVDFILYMEDIDKITEIEPETEGANAWVGLKNELVEHRRNMRKSLMVNLMIAEYAWKDTVRMVVGTDERTSDRINEENAEKR